MKSRRAPIRQAAAVQFGRGLQWLTRRQRLIMPIIVVCLLPPLCLRYGPMFWSAYKSDRDSFTPFFTPIAALLAGFVALGQLRIARLRHEEQTRADRQRRITESFSKAVEQFGSDKLEVRLGGIYSLERISRESPDDYWMVMENLTAFVRERTRRNEAEAQDTARQDQTGEPPTADVAAVLTVIKRRSDWNRKREAAEVWRLDLSKARLAGASLRNADLSGANLRDTGLSGANLRGAGLRDAVLVRAGLRDANLSGAVLSDGNLREANLSRANLSNTLLNDADLSSADLSGANLSGANLSRANLSHANLSGADLSGANLSGANLNRANLGRVNLTRVNLGGANLRGADLSRANLNRANLGSTDLRDANLGGAHLNGADLSGANLSGVDLSGADLSDARAISQSVLDKAWGVGTHLPPGLSLKPCPP